MKIIELDSDIDHSNCSTLRKSKTMTDVEIKNLADKMNTNRSTYQSQHILIAKNPNQEVSKPVGTEADLGLELSMIQIPEEKMYTESKV